MTGGDDMALGGSSDWTPGQSEHFHKGMLLIPGFRSEVGQAAIAPECTDLREHTQTLACVLL